MNYNPTGKVNGFTLKMIAVITMFIDHFAASVLERAIVIGNIGFIEDRRSMWLVIYYIMRGIGRMAFPIYIYLLVEGFMHTKSVPKYALRLFVFALISELPFDFALLYNGYWNDNYDGSHFITHIIGLTAHQNVFFTLCLGLLMIWGMDRIRQGFMEKENDTSQKGFAFLLLRMFLQFVLLIAAMIVAYIIRCDYSVAGIVSIGLMYLFRDYRIAGFSLSILALTFMAGQIEALSLLMLIPVYFYNGERGKQAKYFFYGFYPAHLALLALLVLALGLPIFM